MAQSRDNSIVQTYLGLRVAMLMLVLLLFVAVGIQVALTWWAGQLCLQTSLSAYYYTPARPAFIAALSAVGACLILYRGHSDVENVLLDFSGFLAIVVAFVPTRVQDGACDTSNVPAAAEITSAARNNVIALFVVGIAALAVTWLLSRGRYVGANRPVTPAARWTFAISLVALLGGFTFFAFAPAMFERDGHGAAAFALFLGILAVVVVNGWQADEQKYRMIYCSLAVAITAIALTIYLLAFDRYLFWLETVLIVGFAVFWVIQTYEQRELGTSSQASTMPPNNGRDAVATTEGRA